MVRKRGGTPTAERVQQIADYFGISVESLSGRDNRPTKINVLGRVAAGVPLEAIEHVIGTEEISAAMASTGEFFGLKIKGDSMSPEIKNGDIVIVRKQDDAESGDIVVALVNGGDAVCKKLRKYNKMLMLLSINPEYEPITTKDNPIRIIGKVVENRRSY